MGKPGSVAIPATLLDALKVADYRSAQPPAYTVRRSALDPRRMRGICSHVMALRADRKDAPDRAPREPFEPQDQAAVSAQPAQRHADVRFTRPLGAPANFRQRAQDRRPPRWARRFPSGRQRRRAFAAGARDQTPSREETGGGIVAVDRL